MKGKRRYRYPELNELAENKLNLSEKFNIFMGMTLVLILLYWIIFLPFYPDFVLLYIVLLIIIYLTFEDVHLSYSSRESIVEVFECILNYSKGNLVIESFERGPDNRILHLKSASRDYPEKFTLVFPPGVKARTIVAPRYMKIETKCIHPFSISLSRISSGRTRYISENKNLQMIADKFGILGKYEYIVTTMDDTLVAELRGIKITKYPKKAAFHVIQILNLMQIIMMVSTIEKPVVNNITQDDNINPEDLVTVCFKCEKSIKFWKKRERNSIPNCPHCGSPTNTIIAPYREDSTPYKIRRMKKFMESFDEGGKQQSEVE